MRTRREDIGGLGNLLFKEAYIWAQMRDGHIPDVYVQSTKYWGKFKTTRHESYYKEEIRQRFSHGIGNKSIPFVAVHIRRGDYLKAAQFHVSLWDTDYYKKALALFPNEKFLVFCKDNQSLEIDAADRDWCKEFMTNLVGEGRFALAPTDTEETDDLNAMASCKSLIMANSSFSWWAAFLGNHEKVICPKKWFTDGVQRTELFPNWELL